MAIDRPEKLSDGFVEREERDRFPMPAFVELAQIMLGRGRTFRFPARGMSMTPIIKDKDVITLAPVSGERNIGLGEVAAYLHRLSDGQRLVVHRVVGRRDSSCLIGPTTGGDTTPSPSLRATSLAAIAAATGDS